MGDVYMKENSKLTPSYYGCEGGDIIDIVGVMFGREMQIGFINGNILKYIKRWDSKNGLIDLRKAREYLDRLIEIVESMETTEEHKKDVCKKRC